MKKTFRPGSMAAADAKSAKRFFIGASIIVAAIILVFVLPFPVDSIVGYAHAYYQRAAGLSKVAGFIVAGAWYWFLWFKSADIMTKSGDRATPALVLLVGLALMLCLFAGFNFSLDGIEK